MSGRRCKALRTKFATVFGRLPHHGGRDRKTGRIISSEWRRVKRAHYFATSKGLRFSA